MKRVIYVAKNGSDLALGLKDQPVKTISKAAMMAEAGDTVIIGEGTYREWVKPMRSGTDENNRITYKAKAGEKVIIKGSEVVEHWAPFAGTVWLAKVPNSLFGDYNPYSERIYGDWFLYPKDAEVHCGEVYLNGQSLFQALSFDELHNPTIRKGFCVPLSERVEKIRDPESTVYVWYAVVDAELTYVYVNFQGVDPNQEHVEINVRKCCFYPEKTGINYITVSGLELCHAATPWAPPTADQIGLIGPNWSKGWIIENNCIHDAKCSAISLGKESTTGDNLSAKYHHKSGYQHQLETVFKAKNIGWSKAMIGSHIVRNNTVFDCGQNGIVGHLGCIFSEIYGNHIYRIGTKHEFFGWEIAAIKFHAPIDTQIYSNRINDCTLGLWLDWQAQGTRVSRNLLFNNDRDCTIEVTHGPLMIDNNIFGSKYNVDNHAQGSAFINNLCCGAMSHVTVLDRATPYHYAHSTEIAGYAFTYGGDDRYYNNIFVGTHEQEKGLSQGTSGYDHHLSNYDDYIASIAKIRDLDDEKYVSVSQPVFINNNAYYHGSQHYRLEECPLVEDEFNPDISIIEEGEEVYLTLALSHDFFDMHNRIPSTATLGKVRLVDQLFEQPTGEPLSIDKDYFGRDRLRCHNVGPFSFMLEGLNRLKVW